MVRFRFQGFAFQVSSVRGAEVGAPNRLPAKAKGAETLHPETDKWLAGGDESSSVGFYVSEGWVWDLRD